MFCVGIMDPVNVYGKILNQIYGKSILPSYFFLWKSLFTNLLYLLANKTTEPLRYGMCAYVCGCVGVFSLVRSHCIYLLL